LTTPLGGPKKRPRKISQRDLSGTERGGGWTSWKKCLKGGEAGSDFKTWEKSFLKGGNVTENSINSSERIGLKIYRNNKGRGEGVHRNLLKFT